MATKKTFTPKSTHYIPHDEVAGMLSNLTVYGRLIAGGESQPSTLGISHPSDPTAMLYRSLVFGVYDGIECKKLPQPQQVWLPAPDGPADACGWDAATYLVWKQLRSDWITLHVITQRKPLSVALATGTGIQSSNLRPSFAAPSSSGTLGDQIIALVQQWAQMPAEPLGSDILSNLWATFRGTDFPSIGAPALVQLLTSKLGAAVSAASITSTTTVDGLSPLLV
jgi:hypothetical protein